mmetsp:Transcript_43566/g.92695  ORF Transcript_43566/g.92695 Transcript_43566/m.92695 type:complete len:169 (+) Transcript_43566:124-630(+)
MSVDSGLDPTASALEWTMRVVLAGACGIHAVLDITDPCTGAKSTALVVQGSLPRWLLPCIGILRAVAAFTLFSENPDVVLGTLGFIITLWSGAVYFHLRRKHEPLVAIPAFFFVVVGFVPLALRVNVFVALIGTAVCALIAVGLGKILVTPPTSEGHEAGLLDGATHY